jgi:hypothetical protein
VIWRVAAVWALIGLSVQCFLAAVEGASLVRTMPYAIGHYFAWGAVGFLAGWIGQRIVRDLAAARARIDEDAERVEFGERLAAISELLENAEIEPNAASSSRPSTRTVTSSGS